MESLAVIAVWVCARLRQRMDGLVTAHPYLKGEYLQDIKALEILSAAKETLAAQVVDASGDAKVDTQALLDRVSDAIEHYYAAR